MHSHPTTLQKSSFVALVIFVCVFVVSQDVYKCEALDPRNMLVSSLLAKLLAHTLTFSTTVFAGCVEPRVAGWSRCLVKSVHL